MEDQRAWIRGALAAGAILACATTAHPAALEGSTQEGISLELPADQSEVVSRHDFQWPGKDGLVVYFLITGPAPIEFEAGWEGASCRPVPLEFYGYTEGLTEGAFSPLAPSPNFRRLFTVDGDPRTLNEGTSAERTVRGHVLGLRFRSNPMKFLAGGGADQTDPPDCQLVVRLSRGLSCSMWARVTGDVNRTVYGDIAYFNTFDQGVAVATGTVADPGMNQLLQDLMGMMDGFAEMAEAQGYEVDEEARAKMERTGDDSDRLSDAQEELLRFQNELYAEGGDTFGLSLVDGKWDGVQGIPGFESLEALGTLVGGFTLEAAASGAVRIADAGDPDGSVGAGDGGGRGSPVVTVPLSSLRVYPGALDDNDSRVSFLWEGGEGGALLTLQAAGEDYIMGQVAGDLFSENEYDGRKLNIRVAATFGARRGFRSCIR